MLGIKQFCKEYLILFFFFHFIGRGEGVSFEAFLIKPVVTLYTGSLVKCSADLT